MLFDPNDSANRLYPRQKTLDEVLDLLNGGGIKPEETELREEWPKIWSQDETIGWVYQYFTPKELRDQARKESPAPRNSYELAFRNQFFTPRYVVEFLTDNTLGRIWYEMRKGDTKLKDQCRYMVRRPTEIFLKEGEQPPKELPRAGMISRRKNCSSCLSTSRTAQERPTRTEDSRPSVRQRPLLAVLFRPTAHDLRGSVRRSRTRSGAPEGLPEAGRLAAGRTPVDPRPQSARHRHRLASPARLRHLLCGFAANGPIRRWG